MNQARGRDSGQRDRLVDGVKPIHAIPIHQAEPRTFREQIGAAGEALSGADIAAGEVLRQTVGGLVLSDIAGLEPCRHHAGKAGLFERGEIGGAQNPAFLEHARTRPEAVRQDRAEGFAERRVAEFHVAGAAGSPRTAFSFSRSARSTWVIWASAETAISAGETAPISSPSGP